MTYQNLLRTLLFAGSALGAMPSTGAFAQAVDYTTMEQMFGEPITTSVTGKPQRASEVPGDLIIITQDQIRRSGAVTIPDVLEFVPGIDVRHYGIGEAEVSIRGYNTPENPRVLVLVDGRQIYADDYGRVAWNNLPVQLLEIRQIEVVKGPNSALFGFNAASGVINIVTFDPLLDKVEAAQIQGGTQSFGELSAVGTTHIGKNAGLRISAGGFTEREFAKETVADGIPHPTYGSVNIDGHWQVSPNILLRASGGQSDAHTANDLIGFFAENYAERTSYLRFGGAAETHVGTIDFDVYRNFAVDKSGTFLGYLNDTLVTKVSDLLKPDAVNTVRLDLEYRSNRASGLIFGGAINYDVFSASGLWDWKVTPSVDLVNAVRLDHLVLGYSGTLVVIPGRTLAAYNNATVTQPSFNSGLVIKASELDTIRLTAARGLQVPSLIQYALQRPAGPSLYVLGSPTVVPTSVWNGELAYDRVFPLVDTTLTTAVFFQRNTDLLAVAGAAPFVFRAPGIIATSSANVGSSNEIGAEIGVSGKTVGGFRWNASYTFASITDDISGAYPPSTVTRYDNGTPEHAVVLGAGYAKGPWELDAQGKWQSRYTDYERGERGSKPFYMSDYVSFSARAAYQITKNLTADLVGQQYNVSAFFKPTGSLVERRLIASVTARF